MFATNLHVSDLITWKNFLAMEHVPLSFLSFIWANGSTRKWNDVSKGTRQSRCWARAHMQIVHPQSYLSSCFSIRALVQFHPGLSIQVKSRTCRHLEEEIMEHFASKMHSNNKTAWGSGTPWNLSYSWGTTAVLMTHLRKKLKKPLDGSIWTLTGERSPLLIFEYLGPAMVKGSAFPRAMNWEILVTLGTSRRRMAMLWFYEKLDWWFSAPFVP